MLHPSPFGKEVLFSPDEGKEKRSQHFKEHEDSAERGFSPSSFWPARVPQVYYRKSRTTRTQMSRIPYLFFV
jgi:hypothetical protein